MILSYLTKGGVSYGESDEMTPYERKIALDAIKDFLESQSKARQEAINQARIRQKNGSPKSGLNR